MKLMDMSQYEGEDREMVIAGWEIVRGLKERKANAGISRVETAASYVAVGRSDHWIEKYLMSVDLLGGELGWSESGLVLTYLKANDRMLRVIERLNGKSA